MRNFNSFIAGAILLVSSGGIVVGLYQFVKFWMEPPSQSPRAVFYEVKPGTSPGQIAHSLESLGIISNARMFYWYGRLTGKLTKFKSGDYRFLTNMKPDDVMNIIMSGISFGYPLTVPEGYTAAQIASALNKFRPGSGDKFLKLCENKSFIADMNLFENPPPRLEGFLFPDTYLVTRKEPMEELVFQMVKKYRSVFTSELEALAKARGFTELQTITLASIVEKETGAPQERPLVASVFHNRLRKHMRLQSDPTVVYGIKDYDGNITKKDLTTYHPYNTYVIPALPIGPISNPGKDAIIATLKPAQSNYLYFVSHNDGTHEFTENYEDHKKAVAKFQIDPKAREGHSWRDLRNTLSHPTAAAIKK